MLEDDFRSISQEYARAGIKATVLLNSGAAVAVVSQIGSLKDVIPVGWISASLIIFVFGSVIGAITWITAFISTRHADRANRGQDPDYKISDRFMHTSIILLFISLTFFCIGCITLAISIK